VAIETILGVWERNLTHPSLLSRVRERRENKLITN
jgi:hypothetical protein